MSTLLEFETIKNIRDLGGMLCGDGRRIRSGKLIRCGHLGKMSQTDRQKLSGMVDTIVDFRTGGECREQPDTVLPSVRYIHLPVLDSLTAGITREQESDLAVAEEFAADAESSMQYMCGMYRNLADNDSAIRQYESFVRLLLEDHDKALLWHCTAGKDRAGVASAIVEEALGIPKETIVRDYLRTNEYLKEDIVFLTGYIKTQVPEGACVNEEALRNLFGARPEYIETYYGRIRERFGGFPHFLREGLHLSLKDIATLRERYLE